MESKVSNRTQQKLKSRSITNKPEQHGQTSMNYTTIQKHYRINTTKQYSA